MNPYLRHLAEDRRLTILKLLVMSGSSANEFVLAKGIEELGHTRLPHDDIRKDIAFLNENGLISVDWVAEVQVCKITARGVEVTEGRTFVEGVKKPPIGR